MNLDLLYLGVISEAGRVENAIEKAVSQNFDSQEDAAKAAGVRGSTLSRLKNLGSAGTGPKGKARNPSISSLINVKKALGDEAYEAILNAAETGTQKAQRQRSKRHHGTRTHSVGAMRKAQAASE